MASYTNTIKIILKKSTKEKHMDGFSINSTYKIIILNNNIKCITVLRVRDEG